jgi:uncharacterized protein (DUF4415 family)
VGIAHRTCISGIEDHRLHTSEVSLFRASRGSRRARTLAISKAQPQKCPCAITPRRGIVISMGRKKSEAKERRQKKTRITNRIDDDLLDHFKREAAKSIHSEHSSAIRV